MQPPRHAVEAVTHADPYAFYETLREQRPLTFDPALGLWVAGGWAVIEEAFAHPGLRVRPPAEPVPGVLLGTAAGDVFAQLVRMTDGAFHAAHKPALEQAARRWTLADVARAGQEAARDLQPRMHANDFAGALAVHAMARLLQVPAAALDATCQWVQQFAQGIAAGASAQHVDSASTAAQALMQQGRALGMGEVQAANRIAFMQQAVDATAGLLGLVVLAFRREPQAATSADQSLDAMRNFVAEAERFDAPVQNTRRFAAQQLVLAGQTIASGQGVLLVLASANRDPAGNPDPARFDPQRARRRSLGFGWGRHACPGTAIAIEIVAACARWMRAAGQFDSYFGPQAGFRPLPNARVPLFRS